jgi:redox-sensitive bicupin YhaK (pirin superfamily)
MPVIIHPSDSRGAADHGWLKSYHTFSFASYFNPSRIHFGVLRVLNDDVVAPGMGFGTHPHDNMEIISIPLEGELAHKDSMGNTSVIKSGDIQVMSAGRGITHSEYNNSANHPVKFLQIWIFPNQKNTTPRYGQVSLPVSELNTWRTVVGPKTSGLETWIQQEAWFFLGEFTKGEISSYALKQAGNGVYLFVLFGELTANGERLITRDGAGFTEISKIDFEFMTSCKILLIEVPMHTH